MMIQKKKGQIGGAAFPFVILFIIALAATVFTVYQAQHGVYYSQSTLNIFTIALVTVFGFSLMRTGFALPTVLTLTLGILYTYMFFNYGSTLLLTISKFVGIHFTAANYFLVWWIALWVGGAIIAGFPFIMVGEFKAVIAIVLLWVGLGLIYTFIDNVGFGPPCAGPKSPFMGQSICELPATNYAIDCALGCYGAERLGVDPYSSTGTFLVYASLSIITLAFGAMLLYWSFYVG